MRGRILIVDPNPRQREALELALAAQGYEIVCADEVTAALHTRGVCAGELERAAARRPVVAASAPMIALLEAIERLAGEAGPVLLSGEAGTGKESLARALHAQSPRRHAPFAVMDCRGTGSLAPLLWAEGGTLFVDAIDALPLPLQAELTRVLREGRFQTPGGDIQTPGGDIQTPGGDIQTPGGDKPRRVDVRLVATATVPLAPRVRDGAFDPELHARLASTTLRVPALRERRHDLPLLLDHLLAHWCAQLGRPVPAVSADALARLVAHAWPGNLHELESAVVRAALAAVGGTLTPRELPDEIAREGSAAPPGRSALALKPARRAFEADWIRHALRSAGGNRTRAARLLEISHRALLYKLKEFGISD